MSISTVKADEALLSLPATSVAVAVNECVASCSTAVVMENGLFTVVVPTSPSRSLVRLMIASSSPSPSIVGVLSFVMSSVDDEPLSLAALRSRAVGAAGAMVSSSNTKSTLPEALPISSVARSVRVCEPVLRTVVLNRESISTSVSVNTPPFVPMRPARSMNASASTRPSKLTIGLISLTVMLSVRSLVIRSVSERPVSLRATTVNSGGSSSPTNVTPVAMPSDPRSTTGASMFISTTSTSKMSMSPS